MTRIEANNHLGWDVQHLSEDGWETVQSCVSEEAAKSYLRIKRIFDPFEEYRVYELVTEQEQA